MEKPKIMSKSEFADFCGVSMKIASRWFNTDYFPELAKMGYRKKQHVFTPKQLEFLKKNIVEFSEK